MSIHKLAEYSATLNDRDREAGRGIPRGSVLRRLSADSIRLRRWAWHRLASGRLSFDAVRIVVGDPPEDFRRAV